MLELPAKGESRLRIDQDAAGRRFENLARGLSRPPRSADFAVRANGKVRVVPARPGREFNLPATASALLTAASRTTNRSAAVVVAHFEPRMTTAEAKALEIERQLASYSTLYAGTADRINNLQLAIELLDGARIDRARLVLVAGRDVVVQPVRRPSHPGTRIPLSARDHGREVRGGDRRRRLAGGDYGLQRGLGGRDRDRRAAPARALHRPLPGRARPSTIRTST